jgi:hypothetical protein
MRSNNNKVFATYAPAFQFFVNIGLLRPKLVAQNIIIIIIIINIYLCQTEYIISLLFNILNTHRNVLYQDSFYTNNDRFVLRPNTLMFYDVISPQQGTQPT